MFNNSLSEGISLNNVKIIETSQALERMKKRIDDIQLKQTEIIVMLVSLTENKTVSDNSDKNITGQSSVKKIKADEIDQESGIQDSNFDIAAFTEKYTNNHTFDDQFMMEVADLEWTNEVSNRVAAVLKYKQVSGTKVVKNECKLTLCKYEFKHQDTESAEIFSRFFQKKLQWQGKLRSYSVVRANGSIETELFLIRKK